MPLTRSSQSDKAFKRIIVDYSLRETVRISWEHHRTLIDSRDWSYQLQVSTEAGEDETWEDVGIPTLNADYAEDDEARLRGKDLHIAYRVVLTTPVDTYTSEIAAPHSVLSKRQWLLARGIIRRHQLEARGLTSFQGYLLKRKWHGTECTDCVDPFTGGVTNSNCATCAGTGKVTGYWRAADDTMIDIHPAGSDVQRDMEQGTVDGAERLTAKCIALPVVNRRDIWIDSNSDRRYIIGKVTNLAELNRVPLIAQVELKLAPFSDVIYDIPMEGV